MTSVPKPLIIKNFQNAVAPSPYLGHALMRNADIESFPGALKVQKRFLPAIITCTGTTFTADAATDICTGAVDLRTQGEIDRGVTFTFSAVTFTTTGTLPAGLSLATVYFLIYVSNTTFKVATTWNNANLGTAIDITDAGTGTHTIVPVPIGSITHIVKDTATGIKFAHDLNGRVWLTRGSDNMYLLAGGSTTQAAGNGLVLFRTSDGTKTYLFVFRNAALDVIEVTGNTALNAPSWATGWQTLNSGAGSGNSHFAIVGQDNIIYFCDARYVGSILEKAGTVFDPGNAATYTYNNQALATPQNEVIQTLDELGVNLLAGGLNYNKIYPWDRVSVTFNLPILVPEKGIYKIKNAGNLVYVLAGTKGNIYSSQGSYVKLERSIPGYITNNAATLTPSPIAWGGIATRNGALIFGMTSQVTGNSGVYIMYPDGRILQDNTPYAGSSQVSAIFAEDDFYLIGSASGVDYSDTNSRPAQGTFVTVYQSELFLVADKTKKASYSQLEVQIAKPSTTGQIRVSYRFDDSSSFTTLATYTSDSVTTSFNTDIGLIDIENLQVQVECDGNVEIVEVRLFP